MIALPYHQGLLLAGTLFCIGLLGVVTRRNLLFVLLSLDVMLNAAALALVVAGAQWGSVDGQVLVMLVFAAAAAESAVGLAIVLRTSRDLRTLDPDRVDRMRG